MLATLRRTEPKALYGVPPVEMGVVPPVEPGADLAAAWREVGEGLVEAIDDPACADVQLPTPVGPLAFSALRQPWAFGPKITPPPGADLQTDFLCFVGRLP